jgi:hypothetical protein
MNGPINGLTLQKRACSDFKVNNVKTPDKSLFQRKVIFMWQ